ncbi:MAG: SPOR domain-containing protein [Alphaproteobacteria bacterium]|nr:SPOR domain-containing protein [Alphaproteobacteria bacterium]
MNDISTRFPRAEPGPTTAGPAPLGGHRFRRQPDPGMRRLGIIAGGIGGALLLIVGAWSVSRGHSHGIPVVEAPGGPLRVKPENPGGMQVAGADDPILSGDANGKQPEALAPPPETPAPAALHAPHAEAPKPPPAASAPAHPIIGATTPATAPAPPQRPATAEAPAAGTPARPPTPHAPPAKLLAAAEPATHPAGRTEVQLAAVTSEEAAKTEWDRLARRMPELLGGHRPLVIRAEHDGHVVWRLRTGGFGDAGAAGVFCEHVRAKGGGCAIASF